MWDAHLAVTAEVGGTGVGSDRDGSIRRHAGATIIVKHLDGELMRPFPSRRARDGTGDVCAIASGDSFDENGNGIPDECERGDVCDAACVWDTDTSGDVRVPDLIELLDKWGPCE